MIVRASIAGDSSGIRGQRLLLSLLLFFAFLVCASMHKVAQARALGLSTQNSAEAHDGDQAALLEPSSAVSQITASHAATPFGELAAIETEDNSELSARVDTLGVGLALRLTQIRPAAGQATPVVSDAFTDKFWISSALPRGPPVSR